MEQSKQDFDEIREAVKKYVVATLKSATACTNAETNGSVANAVELIRVFWRYELGLS